jgi:hypothetical protein
MEKKIKAVKGENEGESKAVVVELNFISSYLRDKDDGIIYERVEKEGKYVDDKDSPQFGRNDISSLLYLLNAVDVSKCKLEEERRLLIITEKVKERWKAEEWDCVIQFSTKEITFIQKYLEDVKGKVRDGIPLTQFHSKTKLSILDQLSRVGE